MINLYKSHKTCNALFYFYAILNSYLALKTPCKLLETHLTGIVVVKFKYEDEDEVSFNSKSKQILRLVLKTQNRNYG